MKKLIITLAFLTFSFVGFAQKTFNLALSNEILDEYRKDSKAFFINRLSEDFRYTTQQGNYLGKAAIVGGDKQNIVSTELLQPVFFQSGDLAVSSGIHQTVRIEKDGSQTMGQVAATYTFQRRNDKWMFVASQQNAIAPNTFDEATFNAMIARWGNDPAGFVKNECDTKFIFTDGNGKSYNYQQALDTYSNFIPNIDKKVENLKVWQSGTTGIATGKTIEGYKFKDGTSYIYIGIFTYTFSQQNGKWVLASAQHTDYKAPVADDEVAIKNVIMKETDEFKKSTSLDDYMSVYANNKDVKLGPYRGKILNYDEIKVAAENIIKNNLYPKGATEYTDWNVKINGNSAFVTEKQVNTQNNGIKTGSMKADYLEKINGEWKIVDHRFSPIMSSVEQDEAAIKSMLNAETTAFDNADYKTYLGYYSKANYTSFLYSAGLFVGDDLWKQFDNVFTTRKAQKIKRTRSNWNIRINGSSAFVTYNQANEFVDTNSKSETCEERYLEKISGEWKIVNTTVITKK